MWSPASFLHLHLLFATSASCDFLCFLPDLIALPFYCTCINLSLNITCSCEVILIKNSSLMLVISHVRISFFWKEVHTLVSITLNKIKSQQPLHMIVMLMSACLAPTLRLSSLTENYEKNKQTKQTEYDRTCDWVWRFVRVSRWLWTTPAVCLLMLLTSSCGNLLMF